MPAMLGETSARSAAHTREQAGGSAALGHEAAFAAQWAAGAWCGATLRTEQGDCYTVRYQGRRGGAAGPDFRDAVLAGADGTQVYGDVELHLRAGDWRAHGHQRDPRYDGVVLHFACRLTCGDRDATAAATRNAACQRRTDPHCGARPHALGPASRAAERASQPWPCAQLACQMDAAPLRALLLAAGMARFDEHQARFATHLRDIVASTTQSGALGWAAHDRLVWLALAEALAYGRDRSALRAAAERLLDDAAPDALLAEVVRWPRIEGQRLAGLLTLYARWQATGPWLAFAAALQQPDARAAGHALAAQVQVAGGSVSPGRALIVVANVVLPFASAWGEHTGNSTLGAAARRVYATLPGLPSNQITRLMTRQIGMERMPQGAAAQQGLQQIWAQTCHEKRCAVCRCVAALTSPYPGSAPDANCGT